MSSPDPHPPAPPDAGPWGDPRDLAACRAAVANANGRGVGGLLAMLFMLAAVTLGAAVLWLVAARAIPSWLRGPGLVSALAPPVVKKTAAPPPPVVTAPLVRTPPSALVPQDVKDFR